MLFRKRSRKVYATKLPNNKIGLEFYYDGVHVPWATLPMIGDDLYVDGVRVEVIARTLHENGEIELLTRVIE